MSRQYFGDVISEPVNASFATTTTVEPACVHIFDQFPHYGIVGGAPPVPKPPLRGAVSSPAHMIGSVASLRLSGSIKAAA